VTQSLPRSWLRTATGGAGRFPLSSSPHECALDGNDKRNIVLVIRKVKRISFIVIAGLDPAIHTAEMPGGWLYILASRPRGTLYVGVTNNLVRRMDEHRSGMNEFTSRYGVNNLVFFEQHATMSLAIQREKNVKHWSRNWKIQLIEGLNPKWNDLSKDILR
jgi:putative endonuclease